VGFFDRLKLESVVNPKSLKEDGELLQIKLAIAIDIDVLDNVEDVFNGKILAKHLVDDVVHLMHGNRPRTILI
jgi:hypothetical protein